ncbi:MAG TPA: fibronectin type III domain-containing protein [Candidatus Koribacter sp.]|jgi:hypothetical protein
MRRLLELAAVIGTLVLLAACGQPGSPQPPSLELPKAVDNLSATRKGNHVTLRWVPPSRFTDNRIIKRVGPTNICRVPGTTLAATCTAVAKVSAKGENTNGKPGERAAVEFDDELPATLLQNSPTGSVMYGVEVLNVHGKSVGISNQVEISTAPAVAPPAQIVAELGGAGITLRWENLNVPSVPGLTFACQISRSDEDGDFTTVATVPVSPAQFLDVTIPWEKHVNYRFSVLTQRSRDQQTLVQGEDSSVVSVFTHDVFPPAQPHGLQAVFSGPGQQPFIDLSWVPNTEADLAGYNVYRHEEGGATEKLNSQLVTSPSFRDEHVQAGKTYYYSVSAVDARGNESSKSSEASERVP